MTDDKEKNVKIEGASEFNNTVEKGATVNNVQQGHGNTIKDSGQTINHAPVGNDWKPPFDDLADQVDGKVWPDETPDNVKEKFETPSLAVSMAVEEIEADLTTEEELPEETKIERTKTWGDTFKAMIPLGVNIATDVGVDLVKHFGKNSIAGVAAVSFFDSIKENSKPE